MVRWTRSTAPLVWGRPARMKRCLAPTWLTALPKSADLNSEPLSVEISLQLPACLGQLASDATDQGRGKAGIGVDWTYADVSPDKGTGDVDRAVLPATPFGAAQPSDVEAVQLNQIAGSLSVQMEGWRREARLGFSWRPVASDQAQTQLPGSQAMAAQHLEHP